MPELRFPKEPHRMGPYWDVLGVGVPTLNQRWQVFTCNDHAFNVFFYGQCIVCGRTVWATADGTTLKQMEYHGLVIGVDEDGNEYRCCTYCARSPSRQEQAVQIAKDMRREGVDPGPLRWPANHPEHTMGADL